MGNIHTLAPSTYCSVGSFVDSCTGLVYDSVAYAK